jgi:TonB family protein
MKCNHFGIRPDAIRRVGVTMFAAAALAIAFATALPAMASTQRTVNVRVAPVYPVAAKNVRLAGPVEINVTVSPDGKVTNVKTLSGNPLLAAAAKDALRKWQFAPAPGVSNESVKVDFSYHND